MRIAVLLLPASCTVLSAEAWPAARVSGVCSVEVACFDRYATQEACEAALSTPDPSVCKDWDLLAANDCLRVLWDHAWSCPTTDRSAWQVPATCAEACADSLD